MEKDNFLDQKDLQIKSLKNEIENLKINYSLKLSEKEIQIRNHLKYRLGSVIVNKSKTLLGTVLLPFYLIKEYKQYLKDREQSNLKKISKWPAISIIIPAYNCENFITDCLNSLTRQTFKNFEIICVDDGSTDKTIEILEAYQKKYKFISVYKQKNSFAGVARNNGYKHAKGKYILFLDSDDFFEPRMLERAIKKILETKSEIAIFKAREYNTKTKQFKNCKFPLSIEQFPQKPYFTFKDFGNKLFQANSCISWNKLISKELIERTKVKFADTKSSTDVVFIYTLLTQAKRMCLINEIFVNYRVGNENSLQRSKSKSWNSVCIEFFHLKKELISRGIYNQLKQTYVNKALQASLYYLNSLDDRTALKMKCALQNKYFKLMDIKSIDVNKDKYIYNKSFKNQFNEIGSKTYIPIVYAADEKYSKCMLASIESIISNIKNNDVIPLFFVLVSSDFSVKLKEIIIKHLESRGYYIEFINMGQSYENGYVPIDHLTFQAYYRLSIPELFNFFDKLIYLDCDTIVNCNIKELFDIELGNNYFAGVRALAFSNKKHSARLNINTDNYINSGVLLVNNKLLIKDNVIKKFQTLVEQNFECQDQDIINIAAFGKIKCIQFKYNLMTKYLERFDGFIINGKISKEEVENSINDIKIIHYADKIKPWDDPSSHLAEYFWKYAYLTPFYKDKK